MLLEATLVQSSADADGDAKMNALRRGSRCFSTAPRGAPPGRGRGSRLTSVQRVTERDRQDAVLAQSEWTAVKSVDGVYYWNEDTNETTAVGEQRPPPGPLMRQPQQFSALHSTQEQTFGQSMMSMVAMGAGVSLAFIAVGALLR